MADTTAIATQRLRRSFGATPVLHDLDLHIDRGEVFGLLGPNGAGKTTLVRILATLLEPDGGSATVLGHDVVTDRAAVRGSIGLTGQYASVDDLLTGEENLVMIARLLGLDGRVARARAAALLERFELTDAARRRVVSYSGGMRRRLDLAASLLGRPPIVFLDEPTTGLDPRSRRALWEVIAELARDGTTVLLTTQYLEEADQLADRIGVLHHGRMLVEGTAEQLKRRIGQEQLTLAVAPGDLDRAAALLEATGPQLDRATHRVTLPLRDARHLGVVLDQVTRDGLTITDVRVTAPTLDDVFLHLTDTTIAEPVA